MKYPIGIQDFESIINGGYVYVDKTALVYRLVTEGKVYFLSRPRRFGKSLLASTLKAYFQGKKDLFKGLTIDGLETEWAEYPVFHLSFGGENFIMPGNLEKKMEDALNGWEEAYGSHPNYTSPGNRFQYVLKAAHQKTGKRAVVLIDEYDKPLLDVLDTGYSTTVGGKERLLEEHHRNMLKGFYLKIKMMKKLSRISLGKLYQDDMAAREMNMLRGGNNCGCGCDNSLISKSSTYDANWTCNFVENGSEVCSWEGSGDVTVYGGSIVP